MEVSHTSYKRIILVYISTKTFRWKVGKRKCLKPLLNEGIADKIAQRNWGIKKWL